MWRRGYVYDLMGNVFDLVEYAVRNVGYGFVFGNAGVIEMLCSIITTTVIR